MQVGWERPAHRRVVNEEAEGAVGVIADEVDLRADATRHPHNLRLGGHEPNIPPLPYDRPPAPLRSLRSMPDLRERWRTSFIEATTYDWAVEHQHIARVLGRLIRGTDTAAFYRDIARLSELPPGASVLDIPCGGGAAFPGLRPRRDPTSVWPVPSPRLLRR